MFTLSFVNIIYMVFMRRSAYLGGNNDLIVTYCIITFIKHILCRLKNYTHLNESIWGRNFPNENRHNTVCIYVILILKYSFSITWWNRHLVCCGGRNGCALIS